MLKLNMVAILRPLLLVLSCSCFAMHEEPVRLGATLISNLLVEPSQGKGEYNEYLNSLAGVDIVYFPAGRAVRTLFKKEVECIFPASTQTMEPTIPLIQSKAITEVEAYLFSLTPYRETSEFEGKNIGIRREMSYGRIRQRLKANYVDLLTEKAKAQFLLSGRVDGIISYKKDLEVVFEQLGKTLPFYLASRPVYIAKDAFVCVDTPKTRAFIQGIDGSPVPLTLSYQ